MQIKEMWIFETEERRKEEMKYLIEGCETYPRVNDENTIVDWFRGDVHFIYQLLTREDYESTYVSHGDWKVFFKED